MGGNGAAMKRGGGGGGGKVSLKASRTYLQNAYGSQHADEIVKRLADAPTYVQKLWEKYSGNFREGHSFSDNSSRAQYTRAIDSVNLGIEYVSQGNAITMPYETVFHEYGHFLDSLIARSQYGNSIKSDVYISDVFHLGDTVKYEVNEHINRIKRQYGFTRKEVAADVFIDEVKYKYGYDYRNLAALSDIVEGGNIGKAYPFGAGHGLSYWRTRGNSKETFANIIAADVSNPVAIKIIKDYLPKTYELYQDIIKKELNK